MIPEELTKMSTKELSKILIDNPFKAKYFYNKEVGISEIVKAENTKFGKLFDVTENFKDIAYAEDKNGNEIYNYPTNINYKLIKYKDLTNSNYVPLTLDKIQVKNIEFYLATMSKNRFKIYIYNTLLIFFNKENIDIQDIDDETFDVLLYYPEITIKNSTDLEHTMRDIYLKFSFENTSLINFSIARTTFYDVECYNNYVFSHNKANWKNWSYSWCFGNTDYDTVYCNIHEDVSTFHHNFSQFLAGLTNYLSWESLEGTPYKYISPLYKNSGNNDSIKIYPNAYNIENIYINFIQNIENLEYEFIQENNLYKTRLTSAYKDWLHKKITEISDQNTVFYYKDNQSYSSINNNKYKQYIDDYDGKDSVVIFKGERKKYKITPFREYEEPEKRLHVKIFNELVLKIENNLQEFLINKHNQ